MSLMGSAALSVLASNEQLSSAEISEAIPLAVHHAAGTPLRRIEPRDHVRTRKVSLEALVAKGREPGVGSEDAMIARLDLERHVASGGDLDEWLLEYGAGSRTMVEPDHSKMWPVMRSLGRRRRAVCDGNRRAGKWRLP